MFRIKRTNLTNALSLGLLNWFTIGLLVFGILIAVFFGTSSSGKATIFMWMFACLLGSCVIGFLFGIPKILQRPMVPDANGSTTQPNYQQQVNSNLTEISDWLTKIIVGLGLVNLTNIPPYIYSAAKILANGLSDPKGTSEDLSLAFAYAIIIGYTCFGFLFGYITTRTYLAGVFSEADQNALSRIAEKADETAGKAQSALYKAELALTKPLEVYTNEILSPDEQLQRLIESYNHIRNSFPVGSSRTSKTTEIIKAMMDLVSSLINFDITAALKSVDNGERLSGYAFLYMKPSIEYVDLLVDAIIRDPTAFGQYWGIQALRTIVNAQEIYKFDNSSHKKLKDYYDKLKNDTDRKYELGKVLQL